MMNKIKIGWKEFDIEHIEKEKARLNVVSGDCYGEIHFDKNKIYLNNEFSDEQKQATLIHEVLHGIERMYSIDSLDEDTVTRLGNALYTVLIDNNLEIVKKEREVK
ncbi:hypothetical protein [Peptostreptococcus sp. D1]|uniref:hypothetical protein n=1 Tax=Peptostreptococcus sp. D1 TaxID=72304 RepID=UPI0008E2B74D|nr:hypothetical protein [Peptostreptococcus sp. D1]SFE41577.1 hypothetical protein SAMN02910278_00765 [Peptostreptococcus sp. D1]